MSGAQIYDTDTLHPSAELRRAAIKGYELEVIGFARASSRHTLSHTHKTSPGPDKIPFVP